VTAFDTVAAEWRKAVTLPATAVAMAVAVIGSVAITLVNSVTVRGALASGRPELVAYTSAPEAFFAAVPLGTVGAVVIGVVVVGSEYTVNSSDSGGGRQITTTLTAAPRRLPVLAAKALVAVGLVAVTAGVAVPASLALAHAVVGGAGANAGAAIVAGATATADTVVRAVGAAVYWALTALTALAVTVVTRNGIVPMTVLIVNNSLVSLSLLLSYVTPLARYLPDLAGIRLFAREHVAFGDALAPLAGGLVMAAWTFGLLAVAAGVLHRRDV